MNHNNINNTYPELEYGSLFSGIEGFGLAAERAGWKPVFHCEINSFSRKVILKHYPNAKIHENIITTDFTIYRGKLDILFGGFPCQPYSLAGLRKGTEDHRNLWPQMLRAIREIQPQWVVGENVPGIINWSKGLVFEQVQADMEAEGYQVQPYVLPAAGINAPHRRDRVWFIAYRTNTGTENLQHERENTVYQPAITPNSNRNGHKLRQSGENKSTTSKGFENQNKRERIWCNTGRACKQEITPDCEIRTGDDKCIKTAKNGERTGTVGICDSEYNITNSIGTRLQGCQLDRSLNTSEGQKQSSGPITKLYPNGNWVNFPSESPVCSGNDGFSTRLDRYLRECGTGILTEKEIQQIIQKTIGYMRKESIKAYGNAIVPEVFYQIADAINQYEYMYPHRK